jgi:hypothetical protein
VSRLIDALTGKQRKTDHAQARRLASAMRESDQAWRAMPWSGGRDANAAVRRADAVRTRAESNASPRARRQASSLHTFGRPSPPSRRKQRDILAARKRASDERARLIDAERPRYEGRAIVHEPRRSSR